MSDRNLICSENDHEKIELVSLNEGRAMFGGGGIGKTKFYQYVGQGRIEKVNVGRSARFVKASIERLIRELWLAAQASRDPRR